MGKGRKPLEAWQLEDARRLKRLWIERRPKVGDRPMTQEEFAAAYLDATQGLFFQYTSGRIPLNLEAALLFSKGLGVRIEDFSPTLYERLRQAAAAQGLLVDYSDETVSQRTYRGKEMSAGGQVVEAGSRKRDKKAK